VGRWLRKLRIDELPHFERVQRRPSLIGPPRGMIKWSSVTRRNSFFDFLHLVKPGITGWRR